nr:cytochrome c nitrite reductase small subunit [Ramlibacter alkalitolerans]
MAIKEGRRPAPINDASSLRGRSRTGAQAKGAHVVTAQAAPQRGIAGSTPWLVALGLFAGAALGIAGYAMVYAEGLSYLSSEPKVCANCHIMQAQYDAWQKASHHHVAVCNDCHLPRGFVGQYYAKARNGFNHAKAYTLQDFDEPIAIKAFNSDIVQDNCLACHRDLVHDAVMERGPAEEASCVHCHAGAGHGERAGLGGPQT